MSVLILGGARSGKTRYALDRAERSARRHDSNRVMIATAQAFDDEMRDRIARHRAERHKDWTTIEEPLELAGVLGRLGPHDVAVVDCLTLWLSNLMAAGRDIETETQVLCEAAQACRAELMLISNEVGWGIVPDNPLARAFRDHAGRLHQRLAAAMDEAVLIVAGCPVQLKS